MMHQRQIYTPPLSPVNKALIGSMLSFLILDGILTQFVHFPLRAYLGLLPQLFWQGHVYQLITYPFLGDSFLGVLFNGLILWFLGSELEWMWGRKRYLLALGISTLGGAGLYLLLAFFMENVATYPLLGMTGLVSGLCLAYGILFPDRTFSIMLLFPIKARYFCFILIGIELYRGIFSPAKSLALGALGSMGAMALMLGLQGYFGHWTGLLRRAKKQRAKSRLKVIQGERSEERPPKYWQ